MNTHPKSIGPVVPALVLALTLTACGGRTPIGTPARDGGHQWIVNPPGVHPSLLFSKKELPKLPAMWRDSVIGK